MKHKLMRFALTLAGVLLTGSVYANSEVELKEFRPDYNNIASMQRGARDYMAYCSGCHSMKYLRFSRLAADLQIPEDQLKANLMYGTDKVGETIKTALPAESEQWFGRIPPDLSLESRSRGPAWIYTYLQSFYLDESRPLGVNNTVLPNASMPNVLWELQGWQKKAGEAAEGGEGHHEHGAGFEQVTQGSLSPEEYQQFVADVTNFMDYAAEPGKAGRIHLGIRVMIYLVILFVLAYFLKKEFWRDIH